MPEARQQTWKRKTKKSKRAERPGDDVREPSYAKVKREGIPKSSLAGRFIQHVVRHI